MGEVVGGKAKEREKMGETRKNSYFNFFLAPSPSPLASPTLALPHKIAPATQAIAGSIPTVVRQTCQLARCGCTLRVTSQTSYSPEYITPTHTKKLSVILV